MAGRSDAGHWDAVYSNTEVEQTGWYEAEPTLSLALIDRCDLEASDAILDVGAGASTLVDALLDRGVDDLTVLDISERALDEMRIRLGPERAASVRFIRGDITDPHALDEVPRLQLWHDRATLHFLTADADCDRYAAAIRAAVAPGGYALLATYALEGAST